MLYVIIIIIIITTTTNMIIIITWHSPVGVAATHTVISVHVYNVCVIIIIIIIIIIITWHLPVSVATRTSNAHILAMASCSLDPALVDQPDTYPWSCLQGA
ncbi:MAG: hypothetical protein ACT6R6_18735 [Flavobacterium sp.]|uniref:hypothetical protein n=1 Tax=Flavobacterium sp. TaxID=239 RepID=UPI004033E7CB